MYDDFKEWGTCAFDPFTGLGREDLLYEIEDRFSRFEEEEEAGEEE